MMEMGEHKVIQPEWLKNKIMLDWLEHAYELGDSTYKDVIDHDIFGVFTVTYHDEDEPSPTKEE